MTIWMTMYLHQIQMLVVEEKPEVNHQLLHPTENHLLMYRLKYFINNRKGKKKKTFF